MARPSVSCSLTLLGPQDQIDAFKARCLRERDGAPAFDFGALVPLPPEIAAIDRDDLCAPLYAAAFAVVKRIQPDPKAWTTLSPATHDLMVRTARMLQGAGPDFSLDQIEKKLHEAGDRPGRDLLADGQLYLAALEKHGVLTALEWRDEHWGVPFNATDVELIEDRPGALSFSFETKSAPPTPIFTAIARAFPGLQGEAAAENADTWRYEATFKGDEVAGRCIELGEEALEP